MKNLIQYGSFLVAVGCKLDYDTETTEFTIAEYPKEEHKREAVREAVRDIAKFLDTANHTDGLAAIALADFVDGNPNPLINYQRQNILTSLGIKRESQFIASVMMQAKVNRSWHTSETPNTCTYFGQLCTHRGTNVDPKRRGIRSTRMPEEYHVQLGGTIKREQFITPALERAYSLIPENMLATGKPIDIVAFERQIENLDPDKLDDLLVRLTKRKEVLSGANS